MSTLDRRAALGALASMPALAILGAPTAAAEPVTRALLERYVAWLANEHAAALVELYPIDPTSSDAASRMASWESQRRQTPLQWFPDAPDIERLVTATKPSTRAAVVMSAVGCEWRSCNV